MMMKWPGRPPIGGRPIPPAIPGGPGPRPEPPTHRCPPDHYWPRPGKPGEPGQPKPELPKPKFPHFPFEKIPTPAKILFPGLAIGEGVQKLFGKLFG